jgi:glycosyltransferase involved in cell wall biosynthesis
MPFFSIVIPLYNKESFIENTIKSVLNQRYTDFELVIINDCSTDSSLELVSRFDDPRIKIITHQKNKGLSASRNTGIQNAAADYIAFLDADDLWKPNFLSEIHQLITDFPEASLFATNYEEIIGKNRAVIPSNGAVKLIKNSILEDFFEINLSQPLYCPSSLCVKKDVFENIGFSRAIS